MRIDAFCHAGNRQEGSTSAATSAAIGIGKPHKVETRQLMVSGRTNRLSRITMVPI